MRQPVFPPLFSGRASLAGDPFEQACEAAKRGCDAGLVLHDLTGDLLRAAVVFAPDVPLRAAMIMLPLCGIGFQNALGALAPPELAVHLSWQGGLFVNGGQCGGLKLAVPSQVEEVPDWLVVGLSLTLKSPVVETGKIPDQTSLAEEGCGDLDPVLLLEAWVRHTLVWINRWSGEGIGPVHREWSGLARGMEEEITLDKFTGRFLGVSDAFDMVLKTSSGTKLIPLTTVLEGIA